MKTIGIIGAMEEEIISFRRKMELKEIHQIAGMDFYEGTMKEAQVIVVRCGVGQVNAAVCTQILIDKFNTDHIINTGLAGGLHPDVNIGDIVISSDTVEKEDHFVIESNKLLVEYARDTAMKLFENHKVWVGHIASEDQFIATIKVKNDVSTTFTAYCAEMEGIAIAYTCYLNKIPFVIIRTISDKVDSKVEMNFEEFVNLATRNTGKMIENIINYIK